LEVANARRVKNGVKTLHERNLKLKMFGKFIDTEKILV